MESGDYNLSVTFVGYATATKSATVTSGNVTTVDIQLTPEIQNIEEVVVIGYGTAKRKDVTGAVVTINEKNFNKGIVTNPDQLIQGKTPGIMIINNTGQPRRGNNRTHTR
ncbi:carboxypeptidase-like regulatory domain-containing protein [Niabella ginsengisoli]|uniref:Carboxypeptidase-like regulatory domain-containing protein n=1 Tax=Niabella ginsengisoli TaxID=522298 RepID=A0ABS9SEY5_9BACT|nr:carboxypeptidase-like regulatory domain-containing protein [Niabella ginsengisoli]MCH5596734.1 carboxypeptidase-like regulatory domain-containing protein [Niabella ginsengisoli]